MKKIHLGIDEAGRGCVLGSLFLSLVAVDTESILKYFKDEGVTDSKDLSKKKREELRSVILKHSCAITHKITPKEIDRGNINKLELDGMICLINGYIDRYMSVNFDEAIFEVYIDCPTRNTKSFSRDVESGIHFPKSTIILSENKADSKYVVVGASSIIAKTNRDRSVEDIQRKYESKYGEIGSGYPSDPKTIKFLKDMYSKEKRFPIESRKKWGTIKRIREEHDEQK